MLRLPPDIAVLAQQGAEAGVAEQKAGLLMQL